MNDIFSINRFWLLVRGKVISSYREMFTVSAAIGSITIIFSLIMGEDSDFYTQWFGFLLLVGGVILSSRAFGDMHDKTRNQAYLLLPASSLEKMIAALFRVTIGFIVYLMVFMTAISFLAEAFKLVFWRETYSMFNPFETDVWQIITKYIFVQSFFFLGAAWFKKTHLAKTILAVSFICLGLSLVYWITAELALGGHMRGINMMFLHGPKITAVLHILLPLCCWYIAWLRIQEAQVGDGV